MEKILQRLLTKVTSARWLIAVIMTIVFAILSITDKLSSEFITIYTMIVAFYYSKDRTNKE